MNLIRVSLILALMFPATLCQNQPQNSQQRPNGNYQTQPANNFQTQTQPANNYQIQTQPANNHQVLTQPANNQQVQTQPIENQGQYIPPTPQSVQQQIKQDLMTSYPNQNNNYENPQYQAQNKQQESQMINNSPQQPHQAQILNQQNYFNPPSNQNFQPSNVSSQTQSYPAIQNNQHEISTPGQQLNSQNSVFGQTYQNSQTQQFAQQNTFNSPANQQVQNQGQYAQTQPLQQPLIQAANQNSQNIQPAINYVQTPPPQNYVPAQPPVPSIPAQQPVYYAQTERTPLNVPAQPPTPSIPAQQPVYNSQTERTPLNVPSQPVQTAFEKIQQIPLDEIQKLSPENQQKLKEIQANPALLSHYLNTPQLQQQNQFQARAQNYDNYYDPNLHFHAENKQQYKQQKANDQKQYEQVDQDDYSTPESYADAKEDALFNSSSKSEKEASANSVFKEMETVIQDFEQMNPFKMIEELLFSSDSEEEENGDSKKIFDISNTSKQVKEMQLNKSVSMFFDSVSLLIDEQILKKNYLVVMIKGNGAVKIDIKDSNQKKVLKSYGKILNSKVEKEKNIVFQTKHLQKYLNNYFIFELDQIYLGGDISIIANAIQIFNINFGEALKLYTEFTHEVNVMVKLDPKTYISQNSRFQFILKTNLGAEDLSGDETVDLLLNYLKDFPNYDQFDMAASGTIGTGLIKTVNQKSPYFCISQNCFYTAQINLHRIHQIVFLPSVFDNGSDIQVKKKFSMIEELEVEEVLYYKLKVENPLKNSVLFTVTPRENQTVLYLNADVEIEDMEKSNYITSSEGVQSILITKKQIEYFKYSGEVFFLAFYNPKKSIISTFEFLIEVIEEKKQVEIEQSHYLSGVIVKDEIQNYILNLYTGEQESFSLDLLMQHFKGKAKLAIKECKIGEDLCEVLEQDLQNTDASQNRLMVSSEVTEQKNYLQLQFNCPGDDPFETKNKFINDWNVSNTCKFAIGIFSTNGTDDFVTYALEVKGKNMMQNLQFGVSHNIAIFPLEYKHFHMVLREKKEIQGIKLKVVALYGKCDIFFSTTEPNPSQLQNDGKIIVDNESISSISLKSYDIALKFPTYQTTENLFIGIYAYEYTIIDIYSEEVFLDSPDLKQKDEILTNNKMAFRSIEERNYFLDNKKVDVYYKNFQFVTPIEYQEIESFNITINSNHLGLFICVQKGESNFDFNKECDFDSSTENLEVLSQGEKFEKGTQYHISIQKRLDKTKEEFHNFPIDFDVLIHSKTEVNKIELLSPSVVHTKKIDSKQKFSFEIDITNWLKNGQIVFSTHEIDLKASIKMDIKEEKNIQVLDISHYGISVDNSHEFKKKYCKNLRCKIFIVVENIGHSSARFSLSYIHDNMHYALKEGEQIFVPSSQRVYLIGKVQKDKDVSFNFMSNYFETIAYANILETNFEVINEYFLGKLIDEDKYEFKSSINKQDQILITKENLAKFKDPLVLFLLVPKFHYTNQKNSAFFTVLAEQQKLRVSLDIDLLKLSPFSERLGSVFKGGFKYYHYIQDKQEDLQIYLSEQSGECRLFLNKDFGNLPTLNNFWLEAEGSGTKILSLSEDILRINQAKNSFTIGVYGQKHCKYSILVQNGNSNLFRVEYQKVFNTTLAKDMFYFFDYYNCHRKFNAFISSDSSDLQIDIMKYDPEDDLNFFDVIKNKDYLMQSHVFIKGSPPWIFSDQSLFDYNLHFILRVRAMDENTQIDLAIYDPQFPLELNSKQSTFFALKENSSQIFLVHLSDDFQEAEIQVKLSHGKVKFAYSDVKEFENYQELSNPGLKNMKFTDQRKEHSNDIKIFKQVYVIVEAQEDSKFSIYVKPKKEFKQLKIYESDLIYPDPEDFTFVYYQVDIKNFNSIKELTFEIDHFRMYDLKIEYLFNSDNDLSLSGSEPFLPMPIKNKQTSTKFITQHDEITAEIQRGSYIFKIPPLKEKKAIKITASMNGRRHLNVNGDYLFQQNDTSLEKTYEFAVFLPEKGDFRLSLESCQNMKVANIYFSDTRAINTHQNLVSDFEFFYHDTTNKKDLNFDVKTLSVPIIRYENTVPGVVTFSVINQDYTSKKHFNLITEFKTDKETIVWKDYMDYYPMVKENFEVIFKKNDKNEQTLLVKATLPQFKTQLYNEHPNIKYISVIYNVYLIPDKHFLEKFQKCGMGALDEDNSIFKSTFAKISKQNSNSTVINISFDEDHLQHVDSSEQLSVFGYLKISFIEDDEQEYSITLDEKFTDVPFFLVLVDNEYVSYLDIWFGKVFGDNLGLIGVIFVGLFLLGIWFLCRISKQKRLGYENVIRSAKKTYEREDNNSLEMT